MFELVYRKRTNKNVNQYNQDSHVGECKIRL